MRKILLPLRVLEDESLSPGLLDLLAPTDVLVLGYHRVPDQTPPGAAREQFGDRAQKRLDDVAAALREAGAIVETRMVFTGAVEQTVARTADEVDADAVVHPGAAMQVDDVLVPLVGKPDLAQVAGFVAALVAERDIGVTTFALDDDRTPEDVAAVLADAGVDADHITAADGPGGGPVSAIASVAADYDAIVMGEPEPSLTEWVFGELEDRVATESLGPVFVVRARE
ncbi:universal stress protein [Salarchaeum sp. JOR-1]|uniref:universal stress protein n=1 Tax=Salarchaeum sp. JOR-1 TaxID=2599399 RepID=UPI0011989553|nr:universal stress protein [Salarchaeum sp. JOR-1]QDX41241.1 universal stress protein [Salarchaeum sp. JOR-1]